MAATAEKLTYVWEGTDKKGSRIKGEAQGNTHVTLRVPINGS